MTTNTSALIRRQYPTLLAMEPDFLVFNKSRPTPIRIILPKLIFINIAAPGPHLTERSYGVADIVREYNKVIADVAASVPHMAAHVVDVHDFTSKNPQHVLKDGHHVDATAHQFIYQSVLKIIRPDIPAS